MKRKPTRREKQLEKDLQHAITHWQGVVANLQANNRAEKEKHAAEMKKLKEELQERRLSLMGQMVQAFADSQRALGMTLATLNGERPW